MRHADVLIIGGGVAGASCAVELRELGFDGSVVLVGREADPPYHRPPITKGMLRGGAPRADTYLSLPADVELLVRTSVMSLDTAARTAKLSTKEEVVYDRAVVATGGMVRRLAVDGAQLDGLHLLRALGNAEALREDVAGADAVVLVGGSFIGCEVAASLTALGKRCTVVMQEDEPLERAFGRTAGTRVRALLEARGVTVLGAAQVERFSGTERVEAVVLTDGRELPAQAAVLGVGAMPDVMLARRAGLPLGPAGGVLCGEDLAVEGLEGVYAAGDVCEYRSVVHGGEVVRIEHEELAAAQGRHVARAVGGEPGAFAEVPYFWCELADWLTLELVSVASAWDAEELVEGEGDGFGVRLTAGGRLVGVVSAGGAIDLDAARAELGP